ncbi:arginase family protein [archaeon]|nr:MAG: arginase family protein [archaeon]
MAYIIHLRNLFILLRFVDTMNDVLVYGVPLDPDERESVVRLKHDQRARASLPHPDPYTALSRSFSFKHQLLGNVPVESWLTPLPSEEELFMSTVENYVAFIDSDGCWEYTQAIKAGMGELVGDNRSLMIAVDHSVAAAPIMHACELHGKDDVGVVMFDSHFDGILPSYRCGLIQYDIDTNPQSHFDPDDPFVVNRPESFNADSFLYRLIDDGHIAPENVMIVGVSDYPSKKTEQIRDERIQRFLSFYHHYEGMGVTILPKERLRANKRLFDPSSLDCSRIHVSVDIDVGSRNAIYGARFIDYKGLSTAEIEAHMQRIRESKKEIVSADISEIDVWKAGFKHHGKKDATYAVAKRIGNMLFG